MGSQGASDCECKGYRPKCDTVSHDFDYSHESHKASGDGIPLRIHQRVSRTTASSRWMLTAARFVVYQRSSLHPDERQL